VLGPTADRREEPCDLVISRGPCETEAGRPVRLGHDHAVEQERVNLLHPSAQRGLRQIQLARNRGDALVESGRYRRPISSGRVEVPDYVLVDCTEITCLELYH
jgi:hypothetical protein